MITRPLDLASRLRDEPRSFDWLFYVNGGLIALFFSLFASPFVLSPVLAVDFRLPELAAANVEAQPATHYVTVTNPGQILARDGVFTIKQLKTWLTDQARTVPRPVLRVQASVDVPLLVFTEITDAARAAGFVVRLAVVESTSAASAPPR